MSDAVSPQLPTTLLSVRGLSEYLSVSPQTVYNWRVHGVGPKSLRVGGAVRYRLTDVDAWLESGSDDDQAPA